MASPAPQAELLETTDCVIGLSFGTSTGEGSVNSQLADIVLHFGEERPMIADRTLANAFPAGKPLPDHIVEGPVADIRARGVGTWGVMAEAQDYMWDTGLKNPILVAQLHHLPRAIKHAAKIGLEVALPGYLPETFDKESRQVWTRNQLLWVPFNVIGSLLLKHRDQL